MMLIEKKQQKKTTFNKYFLINDKEAVRVAVNKDSPAENSTLEEWQNLLKRRPGDRVREMSYDEFIFRTEEEGRLH